MDNTHGHTLWCNCLECDPNVEVFRVLVVEHPNRDPDIAMALVHFAHLDETTYNVFGEMYVVCSRFGDILDEMYYDDDDDDDDDPDPWEPEDWPTGPDRLGPGPCPTGPPGEAGPPGKEETDELDGSLILRMLRR